LLAAIHELHKIGFQQLRVCVGWSADGHEWRCRLLPASDTYKDGWRGRGLEVEYTSTQGSEYFNWTDCSADDARSLANKFIERFPDLVDQSLGQDWAYAGWFTELLGRAEHGALPAFYKDGFLIDEGSNTTSLPPPFPRWLQSYSSTVESKIVPNDELRLDQLPLPDADEYAVAPFCLSFDGYAGYRTIDDCLYIADKVEREGLNRASMDSLRIAAFICQRALKWNSGPEPQTESKFLKSIHMIVAEIRHRLIVGPP
jgi:hypothetical protein